MTLARTTYYPGTTLLLVGTKRGLFLLHSHDRKEWDITGPLLKGRRIFYATLDQRDGHRLFAADNGDFFGSFLRYSDDFGQTWQEPEQGIHFAEDSGQKVENIWVIEPGRAGEPGTLYAGIAPASLWISKDGGVTWQLNAGLATHPTRDR
jgi:Neuraminidase (sialidase)